MALEEAVRRVIAVECVQTPEIVSKTNKNDNPPPQSKTNKQKETKPFLSIRDSETL